jgi:hypothetical protein
MPRTAFRDGIYRWRVRSGPLVLLAVLVLAKPTPFWIALGSGISVLGLVIRAWASGHIQKEKKLAVSGPYRFSRNPLYFGNFVLGLGITLGTASWWCAAIFAVYFLAFYPPVILEERDRMKRLFPEDYDAYRKRVPLFLPTAVPYPAAAESRWRVALYKRNREVRALIGTAVVWALFAAKMILL